MPREDPRSGVPMLSTMELFQKEAEREGKTAEQVMREFYAEIDKEVEEEIAEWRAHPEKIMEVLREEKATWDEEDLEGFPDIHEIKEIVHVEVSLGYPEHFTKLLFWATRGNGRAGLFAMTILEVSSTYWEPGFYEVEVRDTTFG